MTKAKILYVEDDQTLSFVTRDNLESHGYAIDFCEDGEQALKLYNANHYDLCILDVMLPKMDGFEVAASIREKDVDIPIIFLTAKSTKEDKIHGLRLGGDDYITKPFSIEELILKIEVFLKRSGQPRLESIEVHNIGEYTFSVKNQRLTFNNKIKELTQRESELLCMFCENRDTIVKRDDLLMKVWGDDHYFASRSLDVFVSRLRKYLREDPKVKIENIHNVGYRLIIQSK
ncbi:MAG: response regulator transcription factor [Bacteroidales bacterium]|mgnify:FL=1|jgi:two-component system response regulator VicR|nr:response regulator transcription factor [Bacteroidales bacterium]MDI9591622.1 response regulator transcription factor [Bacteroidota bacterium]OQC38560.1 MAG: Response regulator ArlR [Bacteroidetes bacterium ADurb.Bin041]HNV49542.1 response regulator transcription factor [Bacteroidales bacterium]HNY59196.1 response regulator transcription factor [Bacteroidales bacterium]